MFNAIEPTISAIKQRNLIPLVLGGDHSISFPVVQSVASNLDSDSDDLTIIHFDAHPDIYENFRDNLGSHASPFARILERKLCKKLISLGIRTATKHQREMASRYNVEVVEALHFSSKSFEVEQIYKQYIKHRKTPVYVSIDLDVLEPGLCPGVSHREAGGLSVRQLIDCIHAIPGTIVGADIVEYNVDRDIDHLTGAVSAKIMKEIAGKILYNRTIQQPSGRYL